MTDHWNQSQPSIHFIGIRLAPRKQSRLADKTSIDFGRWSPDQQKLLVLCQEPANHGQLSLFSINPDGTGLQKLIDDVYMFDITSDKTHIVYISGPTGYMANLDGSNIQTYFLLRHKQCGTAIATVEGAFQIVGRLCKGELTLQQSELVNMLSSV